jgi:hypothetical protein
MVGVCEYDGELVPPSPALAAVAIGLGLAAVLAVDAASPRAWGARRSAVARLPSAGALAACAGARAPLPKALFFELPSAAFPGSGNADVAVHVPPGFDATRRPGVVLYLHGWRGCAAAAFTSDEGTCGDAGSAGTDLAAELDAAGVNALFVALETRFGLPTGEPGQLAMPGDGRQLLRELFTERLAGPLGCILPLEAIDRVALVAHSGGYQAAAALLSLGDLLSVGEVALLDALYGGDDVFARWIEARAARFDPRSDDAARFIDLYTTTGGTAAGSRALADRSRGMLGRAGLANALFEDDGEGDLGPEMLRHPVVFKRVPRPHAALPAAYARLVFEAAGFAPIGRR